MAQDSFSLLISRPVIKCAVEEVENFIFAYFLVSILKVPIDFKLQFFHDFSFTVIVATTSSTTTLISISTLMAMSIIMIIVSIVSIVVIFMVVIIVIIVIIVFVIMMVLVIIVSIMATSLFA